MATIDKLLKFLNTTNIASLLDEDQQKEVADDVITGYQIDDDSRSRWLETNKEAIKIIKNYEGDAKDPEKEFPFHKASKVTYPLLANSYIQLASRLIQQVVRNNKVAECAVLGQDPDGQKESKAKRVSDFLSYELLIESDSWLLDQHKMCHILASWGMAFKEVVYNRATKKCSSELIPPEDVIINNSTTSSLEKCRRITLRQYLTKNAIIEKIRSEEFLDHDPEDLNTTVMDNVANENDSREKNPVFEFIKQYCWLDLDEDGYAEPYVVWVHLDSKKLYGVFPAFELENININPKGKIISITPLFNIIDYHLIDDPEGKFYSLGLNHLLIHINKSITATLRQLLDSGTLANQQGGFVTKLFKTKERSLRFQLGEFKVLETMPGIDLRTQIMPLPFKEPSQVLLALLEALMQAGKEMGFITDVLTGDIQGQNVPATTMLAMVEQSTRAFKPLIQKLYSSEKKEFKLWFHFHSLYLDQPKYFRFQDSQGTIEQQDFDEAAMDISPVADPTMCSEAHKYARIQAWMQLMQTPLAQATNIQEGLLRFFTGLEYPNPEKMIAPPQPPQPNPDMIKLQMDAQAKQQDQEIKRLKQALDAEKIKLEASKLDLKQSELGIKADSEKAKTTKMIVDAHAEAMGIQNQREMTDIERYNAQTERQRVAVMEKQARNSNNPSRNS